jgi:hypothetical protein
MWRLLPALVAFLALTAPAAAGTVEMRTVEAVDQWLPVVAYAGDDGPNQVRSRSWAAWPRTRGLRPTP